MTNRSIQSTPGSQHLPFFLPTLKKWLSRHLLYQHDKSITQLNVLILPHRNGPLLSALSSQQKCLSCHFSSTNMTKRLTQPDALSYHTEKWSFAINTLLAINVGRPAAVREKQHNTLEDSDIINKRVKNAEGHDDGFFFLHLRNITTIDVHVSTSFKNHWINFIATKKKYAPRDWQLTLKVPIYSLMLSHSLMLTLSLSFLLAFSLALSFTLTLFLLLYFSHSCSLFLLLLLSLTLSLSLTLALSQALSHSLSHSATPHYLPQVQKDCRSVGWLVCAPS